MGRVRGPLPARASALEVTGSTTNTTITALTARGNTWNGEIVLRIVSRSQDGFGATYVASTCYEYRFSYPRTQTSGDPKHVPCAHRRPIDLHHPPLPDGITTSTRRTVTRIVALVESSGRLTASAVRHDLTRALGSDYTYNLGGEPGEPGIVDGFVRYGDECLIVHAYDATNEVKGPLTGNTCFGG